MRIFLVGAVVLIVFMIIATRSQSLFGVSWTSWLGAALLSYFVDLLLGWTWAPGGGFVRRSDQQPPA